MRHVSCLSLEVQAHRCLWVPCPPTPGKYCILKALHALLPWSRTLQASFHILGATYRAPFLDLLKQCCPWALPATATQGPPAPCCAIFLGPVRIVPGVCPSSPAGPRSQSPPGPANPHFVVHSRVRCRALGPGPGVLGSCAQCGRLASELVGCCTDAGGWVGGIYWVGGICAAGRAGLLGSLGLHSVPLFLSVSTAFAHHQRTKKGHEETLLPTSLRPSA